MLDKIAASFHLSLFWMSSNVTIHDEEDPRHVAFQPVHQRGEDDEDIDAESQQPRKASRNNHGMSSSGTPPAQWPNPSGEAEDETASNPASNNNLDTHPVIINMDTAPSLDDEKQERRDETVQSHPEIRQDSASESTRAHGHDAHRPRTETEASSIASSSHTGDTHPVIINIDASAVSAKHEQDDRSDLGTSNESIKTLPNKPRDSWDYHADDSFEIQEEVSISEVEQELVPSSESEQNNHAAASPQETERSPVQESIELQSNAPDSARLLPQAADNGLPESKPGPSDVSEGVETTPNESIVGEHSVASSRRKPPRPSLPRVKTRLQDPPPLTPAVTDQLAKLSADPGTQSRRSSLVHQPAEDEADPGKVGLASERRVSVVRQPNAEEENLPPLFGGVASRKFVTIGGDNLDADAAAPAAAPSRRSIFSPSRLGMFSPSRLGLLSKSKATMAPTPEEEYDPLDDDAIPAYKKRKRKQCKWLVAIQWFGLGALVIVLGFAVKFPVLKKLVWRDIALWQWLALAIAVVSGRLIAGWCVMILVALIERHYILKKRVLYFVYGLRHAVKNCIWLALVIGVWKSVFKHIEDRTGSTPIVTKVLWSLFATSNLWMLKILAVKMAANSFHRAAYFDRVQDCLFHQYVLETLSAPSSQQDAHAHHAHHAHTSHWTTTTPAAAGSTDGHSKLNLHLHTRRLQQQASQGGGDRQQEDHQQQPQQQQHVSSEGGKDHEVRITRLDSPREINLARAPSRNYMGVVASDVSRQKLKSGSRLEMPLANNNVVHKVVTSQLPVPASASALGRIRGLSGRMEPPAVPMVARSSVPIGQDKLQELTSETVSAWTLKRLMKMIRKTNIATFSSILEHESGKAIDSEAQAKAAAKQIFYNVARPGEKFLSLSDFLYFLPEEQAKRAFALFELNDAGHITKKALMKWVVNVYKERRALALTLSDNRTVVGKLHRVLDVVLVVIAITIWFLILGVNTQKLLVGFSSVLLPAVFIFGNAARSTFESLIFLFVMHPFDVGDRINVEGQTMIVEEMNILSTVFLSGSNEKLYYPNSVLATKPISNYYRSPDQWDAVEFQIHSTTTVEQLGVLKERMTKYVESLPQFWYPIFRIVCKDIEDSTRMRMALWIQHHLNYQESGERWQRRSNLILHMKTQLQELGIGFQLPKQEILVTGVPVLDVPTPAPHHATPI